MPQKPQKKPIPMQAERKEFKPEPFHAVAMERHSVPGKNIVLERSEGSGPYKFWVRVFDKSGDFKSSFGCYNSEHARKVLERLGIQKK